MRAYINKLRNKGPKGINLAETEDIVNKCSEVMFAKNIFSARAERPDVDAEKTSSNELEDNIEDARTNLATASRIYSALKSGQRRSQFVWHTHGP